MAEATEESFAKFVEFAETHIRELITGQAEKLRRIADELDREVEIQKDIHALVGSAMHAITWGVANLHQELPVSYLGQIASIREAGEKVVTERWVVKRRRTYDGAEVTSVLTHPLSKPAALEHMADLNAEYQDPGNYYIEKWEEKP